MQTIKIGFGIFILCFFGLFGSILTVIFIALNLLQMDHEKWLQEKQCYIYTKNGVPQTVDVYGTTYKLNPDGSIEGMDRVFLNVHHELEIRNGGCIQIDTKGE
jgi:uncharacterized protein (DUF1919 family)